MMSYEPLLDLHSYFALVMHIRRSLGLSKKRPLLEASPISENLVFAFSVHFHENVCILCKLDGNACIITRKMCAFSVEMHTFSWKCTHFHENVRKCMHFQWKCTKITHFQWEVPFSFKTLMGTVRRLLVGMGK